MKASLTTIFDAEQAAVRGEAVVLETPAGPSATFSAMTGREVWLKAENLQRAGSFKIRGAMNALSLLDDAQRSRGVVAASAGNHAQGVALAARTLQIPATVFMPETAPIPKVEATRGYGAEVRLTGTVIGDAVDAAIEFAEAGAAFIHPYDDPSIIAGQATLGLELLRQVPDAGTIVVPIGGGGLAAGLAAVLKEARPEVRIVGVEADACPTYLRSREAGEPVTVEQSATMADGIAVSRPSSIVFEHLEACVDDLVTVGDAEMTTAVTLLMERSKLLVEASGAAPLAALLSGRVPDSSGPTVLVLSGGNVDLLLIGRIIRHGLETAGRFGSFAVRAPDTPGQLARMTSLIADTGANVLHVAHGREGVGLPFGHVEISFSVETRSTTHFETVIEALQEYEVIVLSQPE